MSANLKQTAAETEAYFLKRYGTTPAAADPTTLIRMIKDMFAEGLQTQVDPFPYTEREFLQVLDQLRKLDANDLRQKLILSGWLLQPYGEEQMRCQECMYFLANRRWCDLPELMLPAEPDWWCRLWRI